MAPSAPPQADRPYRVPTASYGTISPGIDITFEDQLPCPKVATLIRRTKINGVGAAIDTTDDNIQPALKKRAHLRALSTDHPDFIRYDASHPPRMNPTSCARNGIINSRPVFINVTPRNLFK